MHEDGRLDAKSNIYIKRPAMAWKMESVKYTKDALLTTIWSLLNTFSACRLIDKWSSSKRLLKFNAQQYRVHLLPFKSRDLSELVSLASCRERLQTSPNGILKKMEASWGGTSHVARVHLLPAIVVPRLTGDVPKHPVVPWRRERKYCRRMEGGEISREEGATESEGREWGKWRKCIYLLAPA